MKALISTGFARSVAGSLVSAIAMASVAVTLISSPARAGDPPPQTEASKQQVEKLLDTWKQRYADADSLLDRRAAFRNLMGASPPPTRVQVRQVDADGVPGELMWPARLHHPIGRRAILYVHGGGFYGGSPQTHRAIAASLAKSTSADVLIVDYRLAPEYAYPAQIDDALKAYRWLLQSGYRNENIVIVGDSVGGNIAIEATLRQMQTRRPLPAAVVAMSPLTDLAVTGASMEANAGKDVWSKAEMESSRKAYLQDNSPMDPEVSPLYANLAGFPPLLLQVGSREVLLDDTLRLAKNAHEAGVEVTTEVWPGMIHQWQLFPFWLDDAKRSNQRVAEFAMQHFADKPEE